MSGFGRLANLRRVPLYDGMPQASWSAKDPCDVGVFEADFSRVMRAPAIRNIKVRTSPPLVALACTCADCLAKVVLLGGADCQMARVELTAYFSDGQTDTWAILLPIRAQSILHESEVVMSPTITTDGSATLIASIPIVGLRGVAANIEGTVLARNTITGEACSWSVSAIVENVGTPNASAGSPSITAYETPASMAGTSLSISASGNMITIFATGLSGTEIVWTPNLHVTVA